MRGICGNGGSLVEMTETYENMEFCKDGNFAVGGITWRFRYYHLNM